MTDVVPILKFKTGGEYKKRNYYSLSLQLVGLERGSLRPQTFYFNNKILKFNGNYF